MPVKFLSEDFSEAATSSHSERWDVTTTTHEEDDKGKSQEISLRIFTVKNSGGGESNKEVGGQGS